MKRIFVNEEWCLGCHLCEYNCAFANSGIDDMAKALKGKEIAVKNEDGIKKLYFDGNRLVGFMLLGDVKNAGIYTNYIRKQIPVDESLTEGMTKCPELSLYGRQFRKNSLEAEV